MPSTLREEFRLAAAVPRWTWRFYLRHLPVVGGLSLIPSIQRLVVVNWGEHVPAWAATLSEAAVMAVRLVLVVLIWRLAMGRTRPDWAAARAFVEAHWRSLVCQGALLSVAFLVFDVVAERVVGGLLPESARQTYLAVLLFAKNPTVIALTFVWWVGLVRQAVRYHTDDDTADHTDDDLAARPGPERG